MSCYVAQASLSLWLSNLQSFCLSFGVQSSVFGEVFMVADLIQRTPIGSNHLQLFQCGECGLGVLVEVFNPTTQEAETQETVSSRPTEATQ